MLLNPADNREHLPEDYMAGILDTLPEKQKQRFKEGLWVKAEGVIYEKFNDAMLLDVDALPTEFDRYAAGQDFGLNITNVKIAIKNDVIYVLDDYGAFNMTTKSFNDELTARGWFDCDFPVYCDSAGGERVQEITNGVKANTSVDSGMDYISANMERGQFFVSRKCNGVLSEIWDYCRDEAGAIVKVNDHYLDALRYAVFTDVLQGIVAV
jgi:hypothetical protein